MTEILKTCLSPTVGTRTNMLPSGYEMSRQAINCEFPGQNRALRGAKRRLSCVGITGADHASWLKLESGLSP